MPHIPTVVINHTLRFQDVGANCAFCADECMSVEANVLPRMVSDFLTSTVHYAANASELCFMTSSQ